MSTARARPGSSPTRTSSATGTERRWPEVQEAIIGVVFVLAASIATLHSGLSVSNCLLCHAPSSGEKEPIRALVPEKGKELPVEYYESRKGTFVRADVVYLKQDFSVMQPVEKAAPWPSVQRFTGPASLGRVLMSSPWLRPLAPLSWLLMAPLYFIKIMPGFATRYTITNRRLMVQRGIKRTPSHEVALGDIDGDGLFDLYVTHLTEETNTLWKQVSPDGKQSSWRFVLPLSFGYLDAWTSRPHSCFWVLLALITWGFGWLHLVVRSLRSRELAAVTDSALVAAE